MILGIEWIFVFINFTDRLYLLHLFLDKIQEDLLVGLYTIIDFSFC